MLALLDIEKGITKWPNAIEHRSIVAAFEDMGVPGGCMGVIDGFGVVLHEKPARIDGSDFFSYKGRYCFNTLGVCDHEKRIRYLQCGFTGGAHDNQVFQASGLYTNREHHFSHHQYLLADMAYTPDAICVPLWKRQAGLANLGQGEVRLNEIHTSQ
jgi:hypothetical protein